MSRRDDAYRSAADEARRRADFLSEASAILARSLDYEITLQAVARLAVPSLADWCTVYLRSEEGDLARTAVAYADPALDDLAARLRQYPPSPVSPRSRVGQVLETGQPDLQPDIPHAYVESIAQDDQHLGLLRELAFASSMTVPMWADGRVVGAMSFFSRDPARRYGDLDLATAQELAQRCGLAVENARLHRQMQEAVRMRDDFLSAVAHDLKNPLTAAKAQLQMLQRQVARAEPELVAGMGRRVGQLEATLDKMTALIDELRDVASLQIGRPLQLRREQVDLVRLATRTVELAQQIARRTPISLRCGRDAVVGWWDAPRVERVIDNLLSNAIKYSPPGKEIEVSVDAVERDGRAWGLVEVRDHGLGIPAEDLPRIFERFHRGANVTGRIAGTGIGLAGAHQIVEQHGGRLAVDSEEGVGSCFSLYLPLGGEADEEAPPA